MLGTPVSRRAALLVAALIGAAAAARADSSLFTADFHFVPKPKPRAQSKSVDLSVQFPAIGDDENAQGRTGFCHDFSAVEIVEAAIFRAHHIHRRLSPVDLILSYDFQSDGTYSYVTSGALDWQVRNMQTPLIMPLKEGGDANKDIDFVLSHGLATLQALPYWPFYSRYRDMDEPAIIHLAQAAEDSAGIGGLDKAGAAKVRRGVAQNLVKPYVQNLADQLEKEHPEAARTRAETRGLTAGMSRKSWSFYGNFSTAQYEQMKKTQADPGACLQSGSLAAQRLIQELDAGRPALVDLDVARTPDFGAETQALEGSDFHALIVLGYALSPDASGAPRVAFKTRNSPWAAVAVSNPLLRDDEFCRVRGITTVLIPGEKE